MGAYVNTQSTNCPFFTFAQVFFTLCSMVTNFPRVIRMKRGVGERRNRTNIHTFCAIPAVFIHRASSDCEGGISEHGYPTYTWPYFRSDQEAAFPNPTVSSQVGSQFMRKNRADPFIIISFRCRYG